MMNLQDFSLLKEDTESYTVGHPQGKTISVPKKGLSEKAQGLISKLKKEQGFAEGGGVYLPCKNPSCKSFGTSHPNCKCYSGMAEGGLAQSYCDTEKEHDPECPYFQKMAEGGDILPVEENSSSEPSLDETLNQARDIPPASPLSPAPPIAQTLEAPSSLVSPPSSQAYNPEQDLQNVKKSIEGGIEAENRIGKASEEAYSQIPAPVPIDQIFKNYQQKDQAFQDQLASKEIDPNRYFSKMDTGSRIASGIALALSGIGSGLTGQPNLAMQHIQKSIEQDIDAQKHDQSKIMNLWKMNREMYQNDVQANIQTQAQYWNIAKAKILQAMAKEQGPLAQQKGAQALLEVNARINGLHQFNAVLDSTQQGGGTSQVESLLPILRRDQPELAKSLESRLVPGVGVATITVPDKVREELIKKTALQNSIVKLQDFAQKHSGSLDPATVNYGKGLAKTVQDLYRQANGEGVFREAEANFINGIVPGDPTAFFNRVRTNPGYQSAFEANLNQLNTLKQQHGLPTQQGFQVKPEIQTMNGKPYMKVQGGWKPVP